jgi:hypothetical protein
LIVVMIRIECIDALSDTDEYGPINIHQHVRNDMEKPLEQSIQLLNHFPQVVSPISYLSEAADV